MSEVLSVIGENTRRYSQLLMNFYRMESLIFHIQSQLPFLKDTIILLRKTTDFGE